MDFCTPTTAKRFLNAGIPPERIFRTDRGDDEGEKEWDHGRTPGHKDRAGDDDVDINISSGGVLKVRYRNSD